ncbi:MAG TPA: hypothetical protein VH186_23315 [Chloroflexia bacterium]|nr:hypothetical protein [Chloroflexia bacterium]
MRLPACPPACPGPAAFNILAGSGGHLSPDLVPSSTCLLFFLASPPRSVLAQAALLRHRYRSGWKACLPWPASLTSPNWLFITTSPYLCLLLPAGCCFFRFRRYLTRQGRGQVFFSSSQPYIPAQPLL